MTPSITAMKRRTATRGYYSRPRRIAAMIRGSRWPCITAITHSGFFIGSIGNQVIANPDKAQRSAGQVGAPVSALRERNQSANGAVNLVNHAVGCLGAGLRRSPKVTQYRSARVAHPGNGTRKGIERTDIIIHAAGMRWVELLRQAISSTPEGVHDRRHRVVRLAAWCNDTGQIRRPSARNDPG